MKGPLGPKSRCSTFWSTSLLICRRVAVLEGVSATTRAAMSHKFLIALLISVSGTDTIPEIRNRNRRSVIGMEQVIKCATQSSSSIVVLEKYNCYGCYCGLGGQGEPIDEIDRCCYNHDDCYGIAYSKTGPCIAWLGEVYLVPYNFDCVEEDFANKTRKFTPVCKSALTKCGRASCECDAEFAKCLQKFELKEKKKCSNQKRSCFGDFRWP